MSGSAAFLARMTSSVKRLAQAQWCIALSGGQILRKGGHF